jgi:hypothetical protein
MIFLHIKSLASVLTALIKLIGFSEVSTSANYSIETWFLKRAAGEKSAENRLET